MVATNKWSWQFVLWQCDEFGDSARGWTSVYVSASSRGCRTETIWATPYHEPEQHHQAYEGCGDKKQSE